MRNAPLQDCPRAVDRQDAGLQREEEEQADEEARGHVKQEGDHLPPRMICMVPNSYKIRCIMEAVMKWKPVAGFEDYEVSDAGLVRRVNAGTHKEKGGLLCQSDCQGYKVVTLYRGGVGRQKKVHRLVAAAFLPLRGAKRSLVAHNDGTRDNNHVSNLRWATHQENLDDRILHGTEMRGQRNGRAKLTAADVVELRRRYTRRCPINGAAALAKEFGVTDVAVIKAVRGENWAHLR